MSIDLNEFKQDVHALAVEKGFYDPPPTDAELIAAIHSEISEAFEEWRAGRPMVYHKCLMSGKPCDGPDNCVHRCGYVNDAVTRMNPKLEGIAVELIDVVLRILDAAAAWNLTFAQRDIKESVKLGRKYGADALNLPQLVTGLHYSVAMAHTIGTVQNCTNWLSSSLCAISTWLDANGIDPEALMHEKHKYNQTRPYKHGGKRV